MFLCQKETGEIALLGKLSKDIKAPKQSILNYVPCKACQEEFKKGVLLIEVDTCGYYKQPAIQPEAYPTGSYWLMAKHLFKGDTPVYLIRKGQFEKQFIMENDNETN